jgi:hypothetical protein
MAAIILALQKKPEENKEYKQFCFNILVKAENELKEREIEKAFIDYRSAVSRAGLNGKNQIIRKIRNRMAGVGKKLCTEKVLKGWNFLEYYAVTSSNFEATASLIENWTFEEKLSNGTFEYNLLRQGDTYTYWETQFNSYSYFLRVIFNKFMSETNRQVMLNELKTFKSQINIKRSPIRLKCPSGIRESSLIVDGLTKNDFFYFLGSQGYVYVEEQENKKVYRIKGSKRHYDIIDLIVVCKEGFDKNRIRVFIRREYQVL